MTNRAPPPVVPNAPFGLVAVTVGGSQVILAWTERENHTLGFHIERAVCHGLCKSFVKIGKVGSHVAAFRDGSVTSRTTYLYRVHAWNTSGDSLPSNVVEVRTPRGDTEPPGDED